MVRAIAVWPLVISTASAAFLPGWFNPITYLPLPGFSPPGYAPPGYGPPGHAVTTTTKVTKTVTSAVSTTSSIKKSTSSVKTSSVPVVTRSTAQSVPSTTKKSSSSVKTSSIPTVTRSTLSVATSTKTTAKPSPTSSSKSTSVKVPSSGSKKSTQPGSGTAGSQCTVTVLTVSTVTPVVVTTITSTSTASLLGDDGYAVDPATEPIVYYSVTSINSTTTIYQTVTTSQIGTVLVPAPAAFTAVQDSLPSVTFVQNAFYTNPLDGAPTAFTIFNPQKRAVPACPSTVTTTSTSIVTAPPSTSTVTVTTRKTYIIWLAASTTAEAESYFQYARTVSRTRTTTLGYTQYPAYVYITSTVYSPTGTPTSTTTLYAACSSANFANYKTPIRHTGGTDVIVGGFQGIESVDYVRAADSDQAYGCCAQAIASNAAGWAWGVDYYSSCRFLRASSCAAQADNQLTAVYNDTSLYRSFVVGNGVCGEWSTIDSVS